MRVSKLNDFFACARRAQRAEHPENLELKSQV
jgi:hypothetical protein